MPEQIIESVADFLIKVAQFHDRWKVDEDKELWQGRPVQNRDFASGR
jgi:hypothetical protein